MGPTLIIYRGYRIAPVKSWSLDARTRPWSISRDKVELHIAETPQAAMQWVDEQGRGKTNDVAPERV